MRHVLTVALAGALAAPAWAAVTPLPGFHSPSGNIRCVSIPGMGVPATLRCEIRRAGYASTLQDRCMRPDGSGVDWHGFELTASRKGAVTCSGGILYDPRTQRLTYANLPYGTSWRKAPFTCVSRLAGVTCRDAAGHGLFVSRQSWRVW